MTDEFAVKEQVVNSLAQSVQRGGRSLGTVPGLLRRIIDEDLWQERITPLGEHVEMSDFRQFIEASFPDGLGTTIETLEALCAHEPTVMEYLDAARQGKRGQRIGSTNASKFRVDANGNLVDIEKKPQTIQHSKTITKKYANSALAALNRLRVERPDLHKKVIAGEISPNAAMIEAGFERYRVAVNIGDVDSTAQTLLKHLKPEQVETLIERLQASLK